MTRGSKDIIIEDRAFKLKKKIKDLNFNDQILIVNSSLLGDTAKDTGSFTQNLIRSKLNDAIPVF